MMRQTNDDSKKRPALDAGLLSEKMKIEFTDGGGGEV